VKNILKSLYLLVFGIALTVGLVNISVHSLSEVPPRSQACAVSSMPRCQAGTMVVRLSGNPSVNYGGAGVCPPVIEYACENIPPLGQSPIERYPDNDCRNHIVGGGWSRPACLVGTYYGVIYPVPPAGSRGCVEYRMGCKPPRNPAYTINPDTKTEQAMTDETYYIASRQPIADAAEQRRLENLRQIPLSSGRTPSPSTQACVCNYSCPVNYKPVMTNIKKPGPVGCNCLIHRCAPNGSQSRNFRPM
jgi:hypothetical protein